MRLPVAAKKPTIFVAASAVLNAILRWRQRQEVKCIDQKTADRVGNVFHIAVDISRCRCTSGLS
jgi:hypothetical protein